MAFDISAAIAALGIGAGLMIVDFDFAPPTLELPATALPVNRRSMSGLPVAVFAWGPLVVLFVPLAWLLLTRLVFRIEAGGSEGLAIIREERRRQGPMDRPQLMMTAVFVATAVLWITRADLQLGSFRIPGWSRLLLGERAADPQWYAANKKFVSDSTVATAMALLCFVLPVDREVPLPFHAVESGDLSNGQRVHWYPLEQPATTLWYHDHRMDFTGPGVWKGLAGFHIIRDDEEDALGLPSGPRELPLTPERVLELIES